MGVQNYSGVDVISNFISGKRTMGGSLHSECTFTNLYEGIMIKLLLRLVSSWWKNFVRRYCLVVAHNVKSWPTFFKDLLGWVLQGLTRFEKQTIIAFFKSNRINQSGSIYDFSATPMVVW
jgi:hypothetical protein